MAQLRSPDRVSDHLAVRYRQLGSSDLNISAVSLGTWKTYGGGGLTDREAEACIDAAFVGASRPEQVRENAAAAQIDLDEETIAEVEAIFA